LGNLSTTSHSL